MTKLSSIPNAAALIDHRGRTVAAILDLEQIDVTFEVRLTGGIGALIDASDRVIAYVQPGASAEIAISGYEARLIGAAGALIDATERVISYVQLPSQGAIEKPVSGYETRLLGRAGALTDISDRVIAWFNDPNAAMAAPIIIPPVTLSTDVAIFGDSIGAPGSGIGTFLAALLLGRTTFQNSIGGQRSTDIFQRQGGKPTTGIVADNAIPASGPVAVTGINLLNGTGNQTIAVEVIGTSGQVVAGTLAFTASGTAYTFTRSAAGSAIGVSNPAIFVVKSGLGGAVPIATLRAATQVWVAGRNDAGKSAANVPEGAFNMKTLLSYMSLAMASTTNKRVAICGVTNGQVDKMAADGGTSYLTTPQSSWDRFKQVEWMNKAYRGTYPDRFIDWMAIHEAEGLTEPYTVNGETFQVIKMEATMDGLHPDDTIGKPLRAQAVKDFLIAKGW